MANREAFLPLETIRFCLWLLHLYSKSTQFVLRSLVVCT